MSMQCPKYKSTQIDKLAYSFAQRTDFGKRLIASLRRFRKHNAGSLVKMVKRLDLQKRQVNLSFFLFNNYLIFQ